ncbi:AbrB family transcriptional regulator [Yoonia sp. 208BN28-4]|uniref:AbrB family transcriptional regulator n=1 Tax=Yoonia sp. 208BN28-4 TaxID=3126505 RepID=UPI00309B0163
MTASGHRQVLLALTISLIFGVGGFLAGLPLPWMLGPMIGNTLAAMLGLPIKGPDRMRPIVIPVIGVMLGSSVTVALFAQLTGWIPTLVLLPVFLMCAAGTSYAAYRKIGGYDPVTAFYAAMPGGLNEMLIMGGEAGGDEKRIALAHAARVLIVILFVVLFFGLFLGVNSTGTAGWVALDDLSISDYAILGFCAVAGVYLGRWLRLPAAPVFGPMILSAVAHIAEWVIVSPPTIMIITAQIVIGTVIGSRFVGVKATDIARDLSLAVVASVGMLIFAVLFALVIVAISGMSLSQAFLAYSPGGLTEMALLTLAMDQDVTYVSVLHLIRITLVIAIAPLLFRLTRSR